MSKNEISVYVKMPGKAPEKRTIPNTLEALQEIVEGYIETVTLEPDLVAICNEDGRMLSQPFNCFVYEMPIVGPIIFAGVNGEEFTDCPDTVEVWYQNGIISGRNYKETEK